MNRRYNHHYHYYRGRSLYFCSLQKMTISKTNTIIIIIIVVIIIIIIIITTLVEKRDKIQKSKNFKIITKKLEVTILIILKAIIDTRQQHTKRVNWTATCISFESCYRLALHFKNQNLLMVIDDRRFDWVVPWIAATRLESRVTRVLLVAVVSVIFFGSW